jgi:carboxypeptidase C (cathepsin A)
MTTRRAPSLPWALILSATFAMAAPGADEPPEKGGAKEKAEAKEAKEPKEPVVTRHEVKIGDRGVKYTATAGLMPINDREGKPEAHIFFIAYTADDAGDPARRPLMFSFNGGPGSASVWLHLGALGPKRVEVPDDASFPAPPFRLVDNDASWLDKTDLVFVDPVGTGYSRAVKPELNRKFHGLQGDIESVGEFVRMYLTRYERWGSPLYLVGESYGTTRAAGLSDHLVELGIAFNGIVLVSTVLDFQTIQSGRGNDLPYILYLPSYTATAWYHKRLPDDLQGDLRATLREVERWAEADYRMALGKGDRLPADERREVVARLSRYMGLRREVIDNSDLRVSPSSFRKELLRDEKRTVGRLDSRYRGIDASAATGAPDFDPSQAAIRPPYTATFNRYVRAELGYKSDRPYYILGEGVGPWDWGPGGRGYPDTSYALRDAMAKNPPMRVFVASGYYDLATPYRATEYTLAHMRLDPALRKNVRVAEFEAGHMMYIHRPSLAALKRDVAAFLDESRDHAGRADHP